MELHEHGEILTKLPLGTKASTYKDVCGGKNNIIVTFHLILVLAQIKEYRTNPPPSPMFSFHRPERSHTVSPTDGTTMPHPRTQNFHCNPAFLSSWDIT